MWSRNAEPEGLCLHFKCPEGIAEITLICAGLMIRPRSAILWEGLSLTAHPEYNFGDAMNGVGGTVLPVNVALQLPGVTSGTRYATSSLFLTQRFNDTFTLIVGKTNLADIAALHPYSGGAGLTGFMNTGIAAAPSGAVPPYVYGGVLLAKTKRAVPAAATVLDGHRSPFMVTGISAGKNFVGSLGSQYRGKGRRLHRRW